MCKFTLKIAIFAGRNLTFYPHYIDMVSFPLSKINIGLNIIRKRIDGYHELETIMVPVTWTDVVEIIPASEHEDVLLHSTGNKVQCEQEQNLAVKALRAMESRSGRRIAADIYLRKNVPDGAGLGGGSADASAVISLMNDIWDLGYNVAELSEIASEIGADCPFFLHGRAMMASGIGTDLKSVSLPQLMDTHILIVKPDGVSVSTREAYSGVTPRGKKWAWSEEEISKIDLDDWKDCFFNDFEPSVFKAYPELEDIKNRLYESGAVYASMSGSGSAIFGIFKDDKLAESACHAFSGYSRWISHMNELGKLLL